jgi:hypothetical protein
MMDDTNAEIADLWNRIEHLETKLGHTRTNLTITIISVIIMGLKVLS